MLRTLQGGWVSLHGIVDGLSLWPEVGLPSTALHEFLSKVSVGVRLVFRRGVDPSNFSPSLSLNELLRSECTITTSGTIYPLVPNLSRLLDQVSICIEGVLPQRSSYHPDAITYPYSKGLLPQIVLKQDVATETDLYGEEDLSLAINVSHLSVAFEGAATRLFARSFAIYCIEAVNK